MNEILKFQCNINSLAVTVQDHGWNLANGSLNCFFFYKGLLHLIEQGNAKLAKEITLTSHHSRLNLSSTNNETSYSDITRKKFFLMLVDL